MKVNKETYKKVIRDMERNYKPCKDYSVGCFGCQVGRLIQDMKAFYEICFNSVIK